MKKLLSLLIITVVIGATSCKKDKIAAPKPEAKKAVAVEHKKPAVYDYQQATRVKRSAPSNE